MRRIVACSSRHSYYNAVPRYSLYNVCTRYSYPLYNVSSVKYSSFILSCRINNDFDNCRYLSSKRNNSSKYKPLCPYEVLSISRSATQKEIKLAYFKEAKKNHPDLNPNDPQAKLKFQVIADAYSILSDSLKKKEYDTFGRVRGYSNFGTPSSNTSYQEYTGQSHGSYGSGGYGNAEEIFKKVQEDVDIIREAFQEYVEDLKAELTYAMDCAARGEWGEVWNLTKAYRGLFIGVVFPALVFLRFPALIAVAMRLAVLGSQLLFMGLVNSGNFEVAVRWLWRRLVALALEKKKRKR